MFLFTFHLYINGIILDELCGVLPLLPNFMCWEIHPCCCLATIIWSFSLLYNVHHMNIPQLIPFTTVDGHLSYLQIGEIMISAAMNIPLCVCWWMYIDTFLLDLWLEVELVGHSVCVFSGLIDTTKYFTKEVVPSYTPNESIWGFCYSVSLPTLGIIFLFHFSHTGMFIASHTGMPCFLVLCFILLHRYCGFIQIEGLWQPCISSVGTIFPIAFAHFVSQFGNSHSIFFSSQYFKLFHYDLSWWSVISDLWCHYCIFGGVPQTTPI